MVLCLLSGAALVSLTVFHFGSANFGFYLEFFKVGENLSKAEFLAQLSFTYH